MTNLWELLSQVQTDEVVKAISLWRKFREHKSVDVFADVHCDVLGVRRDIADELADAFLRLLAASEAEQAEREKPIDDAWLRSIDFFGPYKDRPKDEVSLEAIYGGGYLSWSPMGGARLCDLHLGFTTRGQLLDLLRALGIETK